MNPVSVTWRKKTRRIWAIARVLEETGGEKSPHKSELDEESEQAEHEFNSTVVSLFNRVYYPSKGQLTPAKLAMTFAANQFRADEQIEKALSDVGASKFYRDVKNKPRCSLAGRRKCFGRQAATAASCGAM